MGMSSDWHHLLDFMRSHRGEPVALASLVAREGSSYRQEGARMLVSRDGRFGGSLSGGCLEEGIAGVAGKVLRDGMVRTESIDTRPHFGCPGTLTIRIERLEPDGLLDEVEKRVMQRKEFQITTNGSGSHLGTGEGFVEQVGPRPRLAVVGWTSDQDPVFKMAGLLGWQSHRIVRDQRMVGEVAAVAGERVISCSGSELTSILKPDAATAVLVMSHHMATDLAFLKAAVSGGYGYVGLLGSRRRRESLLAELGDFGLLENDQWVERFHAPVGLDLGAEHPATIALSVVAEIQAVFAGRAAGFLRDRIGTIHTVACA